MISKPEFETLSYRADSETPNITRKQPAIVSPATLGFNSHVIKPETRVNKSEDADQPLEQPKCEHNWLDRGFITEKCSKCGAIKGAQDIINKTSPLEQPNLKIIETIERYAELINLCLNSLVITDQEPGDSGRKLRRNQALEDNDIFQKTTLVELRKAFE